MYVTQNEKEKDKNSNLQSKNNGNMLEQSKETSVDFIIKKAVSPTDKNTYPISFLHVSKTFLSSENKILQTLHRPPVACFIAHFLQSVKCRQLIGA